MSERVALDVPVVLDSDGRLGPTGATLTVVADDEGDAAALASELAAVAAVHEESIRPAAVDADERGVHHARARDQSDPTALLPDHDCRVCDAPIIVDGERQDPRLVYLACANDDCAAGGYARQTADGIVRRGRVITGSRLTERAVSPGGERA